MIAHLRTAQIVAVPIICALMGADAGAQTSPPLTTSDFNIDIYRGPVIGSSRVTGMAGAFVGVAEESVGIQFNPAAAAQTPYYSNTWFDWYIDWAFLAPGLFQGSDFDFDNSGVASGENFLAYYVAGGLQFGEFGVAAYFTGQFSSFSHGSEADTQWKTEVGEGALSFGYGFWRHQIIVGAAVTIAYVTLQPEENLFSSWVAPALGAHLGVIYRPTDLPFRIGIAGQTPMADIPPSACDPTTCPEDVVLPKGIAAPWQLRFGGAWYFSFDGQSFNPQPFHYDQSFEADMLRAFEQNGELAATYRGGRYLMLAADLEIVGKTADAIGFQGLTTQTRMVSGQNINISAHLGAEAEIVARRLRLRTGTYYEPSRYEDGSGRMHVTFGVLVRMFDWKVPLFGHHGLCFQGAVDLAQRYSNIGGSILSFWH